MCCMYNFSFLYRKYVVMNKGRVRSIKIYNIFNMCYCIPFYSIDRKRTWECIGWKIWKPELILSVTFCVEKIRRTVLARCTDKSSSAYKFPDDFCRGGQSSPIVLTPRKKSPHTVVTPDKGSPAIRSPIITNGVLNFFVWCQVIFGILKFKTRAPHVGALFARRMSRSIN